MRHVEGGADRREVLLYLFGSLAVSFRGRRDAQRQQQFRRGRTRVTGFAEDRMQALARQVIKYKIDDAPGVVGFFAGAGVGLAAGVHAPEKTSAGADRRSQLETVPGNMGFTL